MTLSIEPTSSTLGAYVKGLSLADLTDGEFEAIRLAFLEHAVLVFPGQHMEDDAQIAFARRFGRLSIKAQPFSNEKDDGTLRAPAAPLLRLFRGIPIHPSRPFQQKPLYCPRARCRRRVVRPSGQICEQPMQPCRKTNAYASRACRRTTPSTTPNRR